MMDNGLIMTSEENYDNKQIFLLQQKRIKSLKQLKILPQIFNYIDPACHNCLITFLGAIHLKGIHI